MIVKNDPKGSTFPYKADEVHRIAVRDISDEVIETVDREVIGYPPECGIVECRT